MPRSVPEMIYQTTQVKFDLAGQSIALTAHHVFPYLKKAKVVEDKTSVVFQEVVACRSTCVLNSDGSLQHEQAIWYNKGPFTYEQLRAMCKYKEKISNRNWYKHMNNAARVSVMHDEFRIMNFLALNKGSIEHEAN